MRERETAWRREAARNRAICQRREIYLEKEDYSERVWKRRPNARGCLWKRAKRVRAQRECQREKEGE